jgi:thymidylate kinase
VSGRPGANRRTVVELCGLPGSGKTTLARALVEVLAVAGVEATVLDASISAAVGRPVRAARRLGLASTSALRRPVPSARAAAWFASGRQSPGDASSAFVQWLAVQRLVDRADGAATLHLLEEGAVQTLWTALLRADGPSTASSAWALLPRSGRSDLVVLVDVPLETASARLARRRSRHSRTQLLDADARRAELARGQALLEDLVGHCPLPVIRVAGEDARPARQLAEAVAPRLLELAETLGPGPR